MTYLLIKYPNGRSAFCIPFKNLKSLDEFTINYSNSSTLLESLNRFLSLNIKAEDYSSYELFIFDGDNDVDIKDELPIKYENNNFDIQLLLHIINANLSDENFKMRLKQYGISIESLSSLFGDELYKVIRSVYFVLSMYNYEVPLVSTSRNLLDSDILDDLSRFDFEEISKIYSEMRVFDGMPVKKTNNDLFLLLRAMGLYSIDEAKRRVFNKLVSSEQRTRRYYD